ncbi:MULTISPECIES: Fur-regulated basic protein FbpA [Gracilibacillus]|uniref:Fur-regulated basic protein FbpA n=1 Tax=Gracilibacillus TaxID=74385 RepID=UPI00082581F0|nr:MULTISPECIES: Fur-regulated basic protein FbpA [Gracilibacillus]
MAFLREAVEMQKLYLIEQLMANGIVEQNNNDLYHKSISEIVHDYERFCLEFDKDLTLKLLRYDPSQKDEKLSFQ